MLHQIIILQMALWRVLDIYKRGAKLRGQAPAITNSLQLRQKGQLKAERIGAFAAKPLCESPRKTAVGIF